MQLVDSVKKIVCFACDSDYIICTSSIYTIVPPAMDKSICRRQMCSSTAAPATQQHQSSTVTHR